MVADGDPPVSAAPAEGKKLGGDSDAPKKLKFPGVEKFVFDTPLYDVFEGVEGDGSGRLASRSTRIEGHCPICGTSRVFSQTSGIAYGSPPATIVHVNDGYYQIQFSCSFNDDHKIDILILVNRGKLRKVGQFPSVADIANDAAKIYTKVLKAEDKRELSRAVGLAAHGIGIGSFVYMRRVFERLIVQRSTEAGLPQPDFEKLRMREKIGALKDYLPPFLVENNALYGILSLGIHQLTEDQCLAFYDVLHESILTILEDDQRRQEDAKRRKSLSEAIGKIKSALGDAE